jgi:hypothetical protein
MRPFILTHGSIAAVWITLGVILLLKIAFLGNESRSLEKQRGADFISRNELSNQLNRLRSQLDYEASAPALDEAIRKLGLPLQPPTIASADAR